MQKTTEFCNNQKNMIFITEVRLRNTFMTQDSRCFEATHTVVTHVYSKFKEMKGNGTTIIGTILKKCN